MRLIDADALIKYCDDNWIPLNVDAVVEQPTIDAVEVVRCRECKYWDRDWIPSYSDGTCYYCPMIDLVTYEHFYCKYGNLKG